MVPFLGEEWCALFVAEAGTLPPVPGATAVNETTYRSADGSTTAVTYRIVDGRIVSAAPGRDPDADLRSDVPTEAYAAYCGGDADPMMRAVLNGEVRTTGDFDKAEIIQAVWTTEQFAAVLKRVHDRTKYA